VTNLDKLPKGTKVEDVTPEGAINTEKPGDYTGKIKVTYPDGSSEEKDVPVTVKDNTPEDKKTTVDDSNVKPVKPTDDKQETGIKVTNPDKDTKVTAKDEDGKDVPAVINPNTGEIEVTPGKDVDGPITVVVEDPDLPGGKVEVEVPVIGHEKGRDDNGNGYPSDGGEYIIPGIRYRDHKTPTFSVYTVAPEKTEVGTPVRDTLWYVFRINDFEYDVVRNGVVTKRKMDVTPVLKNDRTMLPLRYVAEALQADVKWDAKTRTATFTKDGLVASIQIDSDEIVLSNGKTVKMDSKPLNINDRILVSVTNVANVFGLTNGNTQDKIDQDIEWEQQDKSATIYIRR
ncbi:MAG: stalk domain-containing protein, partial [Peptoniphilus harei]|nr:stalk domain-containing protein [Peptoniphilus harei]